MTLTSLIQFITGLINDSISILLALALFAFFWNIFQTFGNIDNVEKRKDGRDALMWSAIALFVIVSLSGIIAIFQATFPDLQAR
jgi:heme A synthase